MPRPEKGTQTRICQVSVIRTFSGPKPRLEVWNHTEAFW